MAFSLVTEARSPSSRCSMRSRARCSRASSRSSPARCAGRTSRLRSSPCCSWVRSCGCDVERSARANARPGSGARCSPRSAWSPSGCSPTSSPAALRASVRGLRRRADLSGHGHRRRGAAADRGRAPRDGVRARATDRRRRLRALRRPVALEARGGGAEHLPAGAGVPLSPVREDPASFRRLFRRSTGVTPSAYRRKLQLSAFARRTGR